CPARIRSPSTTMRALRAGAAGASGSGTVRDARAAAPIATSAATASTPRTLFTRDTVVRVKHPGRKTPRAPEKGPGASGTVRTAGPAGFGLVAARGLLRLEAAAAVDRLVAAGLEGHPGLLAALRARRREELALAAVAPATAAAARLASAAAARA